MKTQASERLIIALDSADVAEAQRLVDELNGLVRFYKVGLAMQLAEGTDGFVRSLIAGGRKVFLDYKYYDVPATLCKAVGRAAKTGVSFLTIHGSSRLIRAAVEAKSQSDLKLFAVTVLTSMDSTDMQEMGYSNHTPEELVLFRARKALEAGCDGVIASGREAEKIKALSRGKLLVVTPGIRPEGYPEDDQKRTVTPGQAIQAGADYLVVGRPITGDADPRGRAQEFINEMQAAFDQLDAAGPK